MPSSYLLVNECICVSTHRLPATWNRILRKEIFNTPKHTADILVFSVQTSTKNVFLIIAERL